MSSSGNNQGLNKKRSNGEQNPAFCSPFSVENDFGVQFGRFCARNSSGESRGGNQLGIEARLVERFDGDADILFLAPQPYRVIGDFPDVELKPCLVVYFVRSAVFERAFDVLPLL